MLSFNRSNLSGIVILFTLTACGGGDDDGPAPAATATGAFKDGNVSGLSYRSGAQSGVTDENGLFTFEVGRDVTFSVGAVTIGTAMGKSVITPLDLVPGGRTSDPAVQNIVRFLMMLDGDGLALNGITISAAVQAVAETWTPVNFGVAVDDFEAELGTIPMEVATAEMRLGVFVPSPEEAGAHLLNTFACIHAGAFRGTFSGTFSGNIGVLVNAGGSGMLNGSTPDRSGIVEGLGFNGDDIILLTGESAQSVRLNDQGTFVTGDIDDSVAFSGEFTSPDSMEGAWSTTDPAGGTFSATRIAGASDAVLRFAGTFEATAPSLAAYGLFAFDVDANDEVTGVALTVAAEDGTLDETIGLSGSVTRPPLVNTLEITATTDDSGAEIVGTLHPFDGTMAGTWTDGDGNSGTFQGSGCILNPDPTPPANAN